MSLADRVTAWDDEPGEGSPEPPPTYPSANGSDDWVEKFIARHSIAVRRGPISWNGSGRKWELESCPFNPEHTGGSAVITQGGDGKLGFKCQHQSCTDQHWQQLRAHFEEQRAQIGQAAGSQPRGIIRSITEVPPIEGFGSTAINYLIQDAVPEATITLLTGGFGCGKSSLTSRWAADLATEGRPALILDRENPISAVRDRFHRLEIVSGPLLRYWGGWLPETAPQPGSPIVLSWVTACELKPLIIIDSFTAFLQGDENDAQTVRAWFDGVVRPVVHAGATVIVLHNDGKSETAKDFRGSSAIGDAVDVAYHVTNTSSNPPHLDKLRLRPYKLRVGRPEDGGMFHYDDGRFSRDCGTQAPVKTIPERLTELLRAHPGIKTSDFEDIANDHQLGRDRARLFLSESVLSGKVRRETGSKNSKRHYLLDSDGNCQ
jgi:hypothetical protein